LVLVVSRGSDVLLEVIKKWIRLDKTIISDCWKAYDCLASEGYTHFSVNHSVKFVDPKTGAHTQNIKRVWREVRGGVPRFGRNKQHFAGYLAEFLFKLHVHRAPTCIFVYGGRAVFASSAVVGLF